MLAITPTPLSETSACSGVIISSTTPETLLNRTLSMNRHLKYMSGCPKRCSRSISNNKQDIFYFFARTEADPRDYGNPCADALNARSCHKVDDRIRTTTKIPDDHQNSHLVIKFPKEIISPDVSSRILFKEISSGAATAVRTILKIVRIHLN